jgi:hypothetical protein
LIGVLGALVKKQRAGIEQSRAIEGLLFRAWLPLAIASGRTTSDNNHHRTTVKKRPSFILIGRLQLLISFSDYSLPSWENAQNSENN